MCDIYVRTFSYGFFGVFLPGLWGSLILTISIEKLNDFKNECIELTY